MTILQFPLKIVSIIVPAKNEEEQIANTIEGAFRSMEFFGVLGEVIAVNDGSVDKTGYILEDLAKKYPRLKIINHENSKGLGAAFFAGLEQTQSIYAFLLPGDNENDPASVLTHLKSIKDEDVLITYVSNPEQRSFFRQKISKIYTFIINVAFGHELRYFNGTSLYKVSSVRNLTIKSQGFFFTAEILLKLLKNGARYKEVSICLTDVKQKKSSAISLKSLKGVVKGFFYMLYWQYFFSIKDNR